jgi:phosphatidylglycerophosphatase C
MGDVPPPRQGEQGRGPIVAFDFDGTLTTRDSYTAFLAWRAGPAAYGFGLLSLLPDVAAYLKRPDRGRLKAAATRRFLAGVSQSEIEADAQRFATRFAPALLRPDALRAWRRWQAKGARLVIVTASPEIVIAPFARGLGATQLIGTRLAVDAGGRLTGAFEGANCRGEEKVIRLREAFGQDLRLEAAYGDTSGDTEMLALAEEKGFRVFQGKP